MKYKAGKSKPVEYINWFFKCFYTLLFYIISSPSTISPDIIMHTIIPTVGISNTNNSKSISDNPFNVVIELLPITNEAHVD